MTPANSAALRPVASAPEVPQSADLQSREDQWYNGSVKEAAEMLAHRAVAGRILRPLLEKDALDLASIAKSVKGFGSQAIDAARNYGGQAIDAANAGIGKLTDAVVPAAAKNFHVDNALRTGLIGAGLGAAAGGLSELGRDKEDRSYTRGLLGGAVAGGLAGAGGQLAYDNFPAAADTEVKKTPAQVQQEQKIRAAEDKLRAALPPRKAKPTDFAGQLAEWWNGNPEPTTDESSEATAAAPAIGSPPLAGNGSSAVGPGTGNPPTAATQKKPTSNPLDTAADWTAAATDVVPGGSLTGGVIGLQAAQRTARHAWNKWAPVTATERLNALGKQLNTTMSDGQRAELEAQFNKGVDGMKAKMREVAGPGLLSRTASGIANGASSIRDVFRQEPSAGKSSPWPTTSGVEPVVTQEMVNPLKGRTHPGVVKEHVAKQQAPVAAPTPAEPVQLSPTQQQVRDHVRQQQKLQEWLASKQQPAAKPPEPAYTHPGPVRDSIAAKAEAGKAPKPVEPAKPAKTPAHETPVAKKPGILDTRAGLEANTGGARPPRAGVKSPYIKGFWPNTKAIAALGAAEVILKHRQALGDPETYRSLQNQLNVLKGENQ